MRGCRGALLVACVLLLAATRYADAQEGPYAGVAAGWNRASTDYTKGIGLDEPPANYETATSGARSGVGVVRAALGYRTSVGSRLYVSGELEAALYGGDSPAGYLREGTGVGNRDVCQARGAWRWNAVSISTPG